jgi:hypothetical protein
MTPKEKAEVLISKYKKAPFNCTDCDMPYCDVPCTRLSLQESKECALIAVDEIINSEPRKPSDVDWDEVGATHQYYYEAQIEEAQKFWQEVKQEIEKL